MKIDVAIDDFINYCTFEKGFTNRSIESYKNDLKIYQEYLNKNNISKVNDIKAIDIHNFIKTREAYDSRTLAHNLTVIKNFHRYLLSNKIVNDNVSLYIDNPKLKKALPKVMSVNDVNKLLDINEKTIYDIRNKAMLELMYGSGLRVSELIELRLNDIDQINSIVHVHGKGNKERIVPISENSIISLSKYLNRRQELIKKNDNDYVFLNNLGNNMTRVGFFKNLKKLLKEKGLNPNISPHTLRHSFATALVNNGADLRIVQDMLGHSDISTTKIYTEISDQLTSQEYDDYHPRSAN